MRWEPVRRQSSKQLIGSAKGDSNDGEDEEHGAFWHNLPAAPKLTGGKFPGTTAPGASKDGTGEEGGAEVAFVSKGLAGLSPETASKATTPEKVLGALADLSSFRKLFVKTPKPRGKKNRMAAGTGSKESPARGRSRSGAERGSEGQGEGSDGDGSSDDSNARSKKSRKIQLLPYQRAMNCGIAFAKLKAPLSTVLRAVRLLSPRASLVDPTGGYSAGMSVHAVTLHGTASGKHPYSGAGCISAVSGGGSADADASAVLRAIEPIGSDDCVLCPEAIRLLHEQLVPLPDEVGLIQGYKGDTEDLGGVEQLFHGMLRIGQPGPRT